MHTLYMYTEKAKYLGNDDEQTVTSQLKIQSKE